MSAPEGPSLGDDVQGRVPETQVALSRAGVTNVRRILRLAKGALFFAELDMFAHLNSSQAGIHMSRFIERIEAAAAEIATETAPDIETLAEHMALAIAGAQGASRAEVRIRAQFPMKKTTPVSRHSVEDLYTFIGTAISDGTTTRRAVGVEVMGLTVCPCAREMVSERSREILRGEGYSDEQARRIVSLLPLASHNQRGRGTLVIGTEEHIEAEALVRIVEASMSSEIYELMKRPDELDVVVRGHMRPMFVEDVVREMLRRVAEQMTDLPDDAFVMARQENFESIHSHNAYAERCGILGGLRAELGGRSTASVGPRSFDAWLDGLL